MYEIVFNPLYFQIQFKSKNNYASYYDFSYTYKRR